ncbi:MAG: aminotransferase class I/II-fold pyridoxal phosphate-dependent enzyme [Planctomycetota bacterium]
MTASRLAPFGTSIFAEMTALAQSCGAVNLAQGFPDFEGPAEIVEAAVAALRSGENQYARSRGRPELARAIARRRERDHGRPVDPDAGVLVTCGATEAIACAFLGCFEPGDEVLVLEPFYDSYPAAAAMAGVKLVPVTLRWPDFALDAAELRAALGPRTRGILLNAPHNPPGRVVSPDELEAIAALARDHDLVAITDEVYEHIWFESPPRSLASLPGMGERTLAISSAGKTFSFTGWKVGWAVGPPALVAAAAAAHQFLTFSTPAPLQLAIADALDRLDESFYLTLREDYRRRRDRMCDILAARGFAPARPEGSYFVLAAFDGLFDGDDRAFARHLTTHAGVAAIPPTPFYSARPEEGARLLRFAFCKRDETLEEAARRLGAGGTR